MNTKRDRLPPIQGLWIGKKLGPIEQLSMKSFMAYGHPYHLYTYEEVEGVPAGVEIKDGNEILSAENIFLGNRRGYTPFSDWFRWELMQKRGGIYMDTDSIALRPLDLPNPVLIAYSGKDEDPTSDTLVYPGVLRFPSGHFLVQKMVNRCRNPQKIYLKYLKFYYKRHARQLEIFRHQNMSLKIKILLRKLSLYFRYIIKITLTYFPGLSKYSSKRHQRHTLDAFLAGPPAIAFDSKKYPYTVLTQLNLTEINELSKSILPTEVFYPVMQSQYNQLMNDSAKDKEIENMFPDSYCLHAYGHNIRRSKNKVIHPDSYWAKLSKKYNVKIDLPDKNKNI